MENTDGVGNGTTVRTELENMFVHARARDRGSGPRALHHLEAPTLHGTRPLRLKEKLTLDL